MTETEILALHLHWELRGRETDLDDVRALVDELERRPRRSGEVDQLLCDGCRYLAEHGPAIEQL